MITKRRKTESDVAEELQFHIDMLALNYAQRGMSTAEAKAAAQRRFGNFERIKRQCVTISGRTTLLRRVLKTSFIIIGLAGIAIRIVSSDFNVAHWRRVNHNRHLGSFVTLRARTGSFDFLPEKQREA